MDMESKPILNVTDEFLQIHFEHYFQMFPDDLKTTGGGDDTEYALSDDFPERVKVYALTTIVPDLIKRAEWRVTILNTGG